MEKAQHGSSIREKLIAELEKSILEIRSGKISNPNVGAEIIKIGAAIEIAIQGPETLMTGLLELTDKIAGEFPEQWKIVQNIRGIDNFPEPQGHA
jgi:hypothetical protein